MNRQTPCETQAHPRHRLKPSKTHLAVPISSTRYHLFNSLYQKVSSLHLLLLKLKASTAMASSSLCGPSNPLQNLQKHTSTDRTLQQDRTASQRRPLASVGILL